MLINSGSLLSQKQKLTLFRIFILVVAFVNTSNFFRVILCQLMNSILLLVFRRWLLLKIINLIQLFIELLNLLDPLFSQFLVVKFIRHFFSNYWWLYFFCYLCIFFIFSLLFYFILFMYICKIVFRIIIFDESYFFYHFLCQGKTDWILSLCFLRYFIVHIL